jgi:acarbose 7IV-phosphotransferase
VIGHELLVVGGVGVDTIVRVPKMALPEGDSLHVGPVKDYVAHTGTGVALASHALNRKVELIDFIGRDPQADLLLNRYRAVGLDFRYLVDDSGTRRSVNLVDCAGNRRSFYDGRHPANLRMPRDFYRPLLTTGVHVHLTIMDWARDLYADIAAVGLTTSTDLHDWDGVSDYHRDFAYGSDLVFMSAASLKGRHESVMHDVLNKGRARAVIVMAGAGGSYLLLRSGVSVLHFPCARLGRPIIDSNGAGDAFVAAFFFARSMLQPFEECMRWGSIGGEYACGIAGTAEEFITRERLYGFLRKSGGGE